MFGVDGLKDQSSNGNNNSQEASTNKQGDFLSLFENENAHDIDLAYLDSVVFDPLVKLNTINDNPRRLSALPSATQRQSPTKLNASSTNMNDRRYSSSLNLYSNPYTRAMELERERNGNYSNTYVLRVGCLYVMIRTRG